MANHKTCGECANFKVPNSGCTYYHEIVQGTMLASDRACDDFEPKSKPAKKEQLPHKASGYSEEGYYESIYHNGKPAFLVIDQDQYRIVEKVTIDGKSYQPKEHPTEIPYEPYGFSEDRLPSREELFWRVRDEFDRFLDLDSIYKDFLAACTLLTYHQEKLRTVPYVYFVGDNESGKSVALNLLNWLCYRPMLGVTIPSADTYGYLDESDAPGTILEDEAQGLYKDTDKAKIYKAGYKQGAVVPRTMITQNQRYIKYFRVFCFKACAAEELPKVKGLIERFIFIPMVEGTPNKDWADFNKEDETRLRNLRNTLLKWRLATRNAELPEVELPIKGRLKELWKPIIQIIQGLPIEKELRAHLELLQKERLDEKANTLEGHIVKAVCELYTPDQSLSFYDIWNRLTMDLNGKIDDKRPNRMDTAEFGEITKQKIGYRLREVLNAKRVITSGKEGSLCKYEFDKEKLQRIAKKYNCKPNNTSELTSFDVCKGTPPPTETTTPPKQEEQKPADTPCQTGKLVNSLVNCIAEELATQDPQITKLTTDYGVETCALCKAKGHLDRQITLKNGQWGFLCRTCTEKLTKTNKILNQVSE